MGARPANGTILEFKGVRKGFPGTARGTREERKSSLSG